MPDFSCYKLIARKGTPTIPALLLTFLLTLTTTGTSWAETNYSQLTDGIKQRLDKTEALYREKKNAEAKDMVQSAYFEIFENLEGPIRINLSAQKSFQMEAAFGEIRRMIGENKSQAEIAKKVQWLKSELDAVLPILKNGHTLQGEEAHDTYTNKEVTGQWQESLKKIEDLLAEAIGLYREEKWQESSEKVQQAQYDGFKNTELEMAVRRHRSSEKAANINARFSTLITLTSKPGQLNEIAYQVTGLLQATADLLPNLPPSRDAVAITTTPDVADTTSDANWVQVAQKIDHAITTAIARYAQGESKEAISAVQNTYFDLFEASGMENKIGARDAAFKSTLEGYFTRIVSLMKAQQPVDKLNEQATALRRDLTTAAATLSKGQQGNWAMFVYSLLIIIREGVEALLIVAAIIAYLVKNKHHDKLPLIRQSIIVALVASLVTAGLFQLLFSNSGASRELLEGVTMLIAVVVLFYMSHWLLAKAEAKQWKAYLEGKLSTSLSRGSLIGLWIASFLAVYREGAETTLFYYALLGDATQAGAKLAVFAGFGVGCVILVLLYIAMRFTVVKLPLRPFFLFTGWFMYVMAFIFAGKGVLELIEGKLFKPTLVPGIPEISLLGIYPYIETLLPQALLILAAVVAIWFERRRQEPDALHREPSLAKEKVNP
ncbi:MAG: iron permease [Verrucomicrobia bacterium Tous-C9LFEB]|nr:MAG: iron permease [Verrucomicrobia bacterium Tous-C9LFEB]